MITEYCTDTGDHARTLAQHGLMPRRKQYHLMIRGYKADDYCIARGRVYPGGNWQAFRHAREESNAESRAAMKIIFNSTYVLILRGSLFLYACTVQNTFYTTVFIHVITWKKKSAGRRQVTLWFVVQVACLRRRANSLSLEISIKMS